MQYRKIGDTYAVRMDLGEEVLGTLKALCEKEDIRLAQVDAIGAASQATVGVFDRGTKQYHLEELDGFMEITSLSGSVTRMNGEAYLHLHGTFADQQNKIHGGHVIKLTVGLTCEMFVRTLPGEVSRAKDEELGINLIQL